MKKNLIRFSIGVIFLIYTLTVMANPSLTSAQIVAATFQGLAQCLQYKIIGECFWLRCSTVECHVESTLNVEHFLPDAVVSVYTEPTNNPWLFGKNILDPLFAQAGKAQIQGKTAFTLGGGDEPDHNPRELNNKFHEVELVGNPALAFLSGKKFLLPSAAVPYTPYYSSLLDAYAWRFPALEQFYPGSFIPGLHEVGTLFLHDWGPVYPRNGEINQPDDAKAAAVVALRASTIITRLGQPHVYMPLLNRCGIHCRVASVKANSKRAQYQLIYPSVEKQCVVFGHSDIAQRRPWEAKAAAQGHDRYVWILWRHYHGCIPDRGAKYLGAVSFQK